MSDAALLLDVWALAAAEGVEAALLGETCAAAGLPEGFHRAAAEVYARMGTFKGSEEPSACRTS